jgi:hypothetical protein
MAKVHRKIGAVAVYSPTRVALLVVAFVAVIGAAGFAIGRVTGDDDAEQLAVTSAASRGPTAAEQRLLARATAAEARVDRVLDRLAEERARLRRLRAQARRSTRSSASANRGAAALRLDRPYIVTLRSGSGGADYTIGRRAPMEPGTSYRLCSDGVGICLGGG